MYFMLAAAAIFSNQLQPTYIGKATHISAERTVFWLQLAAVMNVEVFPLELNIYAAIPLSSPSELRSIHLSKCFHFKIVPFFNVIHYRSKDGTCRYTTEVPYQSYSQANGMSKFR